MRRLAALIVVCTTLAFPASAFAHAKSPTFALDYRLVLDRATSALPAEVSILDGDRALRIADARSPVTILGDLGEPMLRVTPKGTWVNRASVTAAAARLTTSGEGWKRVGGSTYAWHDHRLAPPPYDGGRAGPAGAFRIPVVAAGRSTAIRGTFVRYPRPALWPWLAGIAVVSAAAVVAARRAPRHRRHVVLGLGIAAGVAAVVGIAALGVADSPSGRVAWGQLALALFIVSVAGAGLVRLHGEKRTLLAGLLGTAAAMTSVGSLGVFWHGVVISALPTGVTRVVCAVALAAGVAAAATWLLSDEVLT